MSNSIIEGEIPLPTYDVGDYKVEAITRQQAKDADIDIPRYTPSNIPTKESAPLAVDKLSGGYKPTGVYSAFITGMRAEDFSTWKATPRLATADPNPTWIGYIPNSRYQWFHAVLQKLRQGESLSPVDVEFMCTWWQDKSQKDSMVRALSRLVDQGKDHWTVKPSKNAYSKSGFVPVNYRGNLKMVAPENPGILNLSISKLLFDKLSRMLSIDEYTALNHAIHQLTLDFSDKQQSNQNQPDGMLQEMEDQLTDVGDELSRTRKALIEVLKFMESQSTSISEEEDEQLLTQFVDRYLLTWVKELRATLDSDVIDLRRVLQIASNLRKFKDVQENVYLASLLDPFKNIDVRIPSSLPLPTTSFRLRSSYTCTTNALGNFAFVFNPYQLNSVGGSTGFLFNNNSSLSGTATSAAFIGVDIGQALPADFYTRYRLVTAGVRLVPTVSDLSSSGVFIGGVAYDDQEYSIAPGSPDLSASQYAFFSRIDNCYYKAVVPARDTKGYMLRYIPPDDSYSDFQNVGDVKSGFAFLGYGTGLPVSTSVCRLELVMSFESQVDVIYSDYIPSTFYSGNYGDRASVHNVLTPAHVVASHVTDVERELLPSIILDARYRTDPDLLEKVKESALVRVPKPSNLKKMASSVWSIVKKYAPRLLSQVAKRGLPMLTGNVPLALMAE